jgi:hypothetical protein
LDYGVDSVAVDAESFSKRSDRGSASGGKPYLSDGSVIELGHSTLLAPGGVVSALGDHVDCVVSTVTLKQVLRPDAARIVALVEHTIGRPFTVGKEPRHAMSELLPPRAVDSGSSTNASVTIRIAMSAPCPAITQIRNVSGRRTVLVYLTPEARLKRFRLTRSRRAGSGAKPRTPHLGDKRRGTVLADVWYLALAHGNQPSCGPCPRSLVATRGHSQYSTRAR